MSNLVWYALTVPPQKERVAETILQKVQVPCFVPVELKYPRKNRYRMARDKSVEPKRYPLFIRYVFAGFEGTIPLYELSKLNVITGVVGFEGKPFALPHAAVQRLMQMSGSAVPRRSTPNPHKSFRTGDCVEVTEGHYLEGHTLEIIGFHGKLARFMVQFMGKEQEVRVSTEFLEAA